MRKRTLLAVCILTMLLAVSALAAPEMVLVKAGTFQMGNTRNDSEGWYGEKPVHRVTLTYDYWIGKYEVTFAQYDAFSDATGRDKPSDEGWGRGTRPVINVSWWDAIAYCNWLSQREELKPAYDSSGNLLDRNGRITRDITQVEGYRLPTEAEWEYAARGGHKSTGDFKYAGSSDLNEVGWYWQNSGDKWLSGTDSDWNWDTIQANKGRTRPVGQKMANELGLFDMSGNVFEWCHDRYGSYTSTNKTNPIGPSTGSYRVPRGGSWDISAKDCRVAVRGDYNPGRRYSNLGFRLSRRTLF